MCSSTVYSLPHSVSQYEPDEETRELRSLLTPAAAAEEPGPLEAGDRWEAAGDQKVVRGPGTTNPRLSVFSSSSSQETEVIPSTEDEPPQNQPAPSRESDLDRSVDPDVLVRSRPTVPRQPLPSTVSVFTADGVVWCVVKSLPVAATTSSRRTTCRGIRK